MLPSATQSFKLERPDFESCRAEAYAEIVYHSH